MHVEMMLLKSMKMAVWFLILLRFFLTSAQVRGQSPGSIYIDCGIPGNTSYDDPDFGIKYVSDDQYIDTGVNYDVAPTYTPDLSRRYQTVRSFPDGVRNCYTFKSVTPGLRYFTRATFLYGNYDSRNSPSVQFDLYLGVNLWKTINLTNPYEYLLTETLSEATTDVISVCLVNTGLGTPFISALDLRPIGVSLYPMVNASRSLVSLTRLNMAGARQVRYPSDLLDRLWFEFDDQSSWNDMSTNSPVQNPANDHFNVPSIVMQDAVYPADYSSSLEIIWNLDFGDRDELYTVMYFSELALNASRNFFIYLNRALLNDANPFTPSYLVSDSIYNINPSTGYREFNITLVATVNSTLPPILNAIELFTAMGNTNVASDSGDVDAMMAIKEWYHVNWMGDPCSPKAYMWDGLNCTSNAAGIPRITTVNLSYSGLIGEITNSFANLSAIQYLDLSHNKLTGPIPDALAYLPSLEVLDLSYNQLNGSVPSALLTKSENGSITLRTEGNPNLCDDATSCESTRHKGKIAAYVIVISCIIPVMLLSAAVIILCMLRKKQATGPTEKLQNEGKLQFENKKFTYTELENITGHFERTIGQGGFGTVYHGHLEDGTEVAVKMLSKSSTQGTKEFIAEVQHLTRVHHKNLVSMLGYCMDGDHMALVYEFMSEGALKDHIRGTHTAPSLSWQQRLQIALEAAQGLEYLHTGCKPPLIHRDVKTTNILLNGRLEAKISDFGLSRTQNDSHTHTSTRVVGTLGYLDPEYYVTNQLSQKSDVYSFGVVLLELITGQPPISDDPEKVHIVEWVRRRLAQGNIEDILDESLQQEHVLNSAWKVTDLAFSCVQLASQRRPAMTDVVMQLKDSLELYRAADRIQSPRSGSEKLHTESSGTSQVEGHFSDIEGPSVR